MRCFINKLHKKKSWHSFHNKTKNTLRVFGMLLLVFAILLMTNETQVSAETDANGDIVLVYFYSTTCASCSRISKFLETLSEKCTVNKYNIFDSYSMQLLNAYCAEYNVPEACSGQVPIVFAGQTYYCDEEDIISGITALVEAGKTVQTPEADVLIHRESNQKQLSLIRVIIAALINGLNPCSISMFLFLIMLLLNNRSDSVISIGVAYCLGKIISFFLIGTLLHGIFAQISNYQLISFINRILIVIYAVLFLFNLHDFIVIKSAKKKNLLSQLPTRMRRFNHEIIRCFNNRKKTVLFPLFGALLGALIACTEFLCSGQIYLTTIISTVQNVKQDQLFAYFCLLLYSVVFVLPLLIIIIFIALGKKFFELSELFTKRAAEIKLLYALFFLAFIIYMIGKEFF